MAAPTSQQNRRRSVPNTASTSTTSTTGEVNGRVDQVALVQDTLQKTQAAYPEVLLTITSSIGPLERSATFRDGAWHGYDVSHNLIDPRSHMIYGEPPRPPLDQERSLRVYPPTMQPPIQVPPLPQPQILSPPLQV